MTQSQITNINNITFPSPFYKVTSIVEIVIVIKIGAIKNNKHFLLIIT